VKEVKKPSAVPIYGIAAVWLFYCLVFPMYRLSDVLICAALSAAAYAVLRKLCPPVITYEEEPEKMPDTGDSELDAVILQGRSYVSEIKHLNDAIPDAALSADLDEIEKLTRDIFRQVELDRTKLPKIRQMMNYYLPTTLKLVRKYAELQDKSHLSNVKTMLAEIQGMVRAVRNAFRRQLNSMYDHDVIDVTADIQVMEQMLSAHGLAEKQDFT